MRNKLMASLAAAVLATMGSASLSLAADTYNLDPVHSMIVFQVHHFVSNPYGVFHGPTGTITVEAGSLSGVDITVPVDKVDTGLTKWEDDIKAASWFDVKQFPNITFKSTSVRKTGEDPKAQEEAYEATGDLTIHGVTKSITVKVFKVGEGKGMQGEERLGYSCEFKVDRGDFGMTAFMGPVGNAIILNVNLEVIKQK